MYTEGIQRGVVYYDKVDWNVNYPTYMPIEYLSDKVNILKKNHKPNCDPDIG